jgi:hypothetical protein
MEKIGAVIEGAGLYDIYDLFSRKPRGLKFNDTDAIVISAKTKDGSIITKTFYFCLKPDGTFYPETISRNGSRARRHRLASFLTYYGIAENVKEYNIKKGIGEWKGKTIEVVPGEKEGERSIYIP